MLRIPTVFLLVGMVCTAQAQPLERVIFGTNWVAEAEHGGFFQALADGTYKKYGLEVGRTRTIAPSFWRESSTSS